MTAMHRLGRASLPVGLVGLAVMPLRGPGRGPGRAGGAARRRAAREILALRSAKGEIDRHEFHAKKKDLT